MRGILAVVLGMLGAAQAHAAGVALVLGNDSGDATSGAVATLETIGFDVFSGANLSTAQMRTRLAEAHAGIRAESADHVVIVLTGVFAQSGQGGWILGADAERPALALVDGQGLRLDTVFEIAAEADSGALVWLGEVTSAREFGIGLRAGLPQDWDLPEGVGVLKGSPTDLVSGLDVLMQPGTSLETLLRRSPSLVYEGTLDESAAFLPDGFAPLARADQRAFEAAVEADTEEAFLAYLAAYPNGLNAQAARAEIERIRTAPDRIEAALFLTRDERRAIQRDLSVLGYDTRGIDGIFGPGTRGAIAGWQEASGREPTRYLDRDQIFALAAQAAERAAEIEAEERARREAEERNDREFWAMTGAAGDGPGLRSYLERYPQGIFAGLARERLDRLERAALEAERDRDVTAWQRARRIDTVASYQAYLRDWPQGEFVELARARLEERLPAPLPAPEPEPDPAPPGPAEMQARAAEAALGLNQPTRLLIEQRLARLGFDPGPVDGVFDAQTRVAISAAQDMFDLRPTGYVNQDLLTMLVSNLFREFFN